MSAPRWKIVAVLCGVLATSLCEAGAAEGDLVFTEALRSKQTATSPVGGQVRLYGPLPVSAAIRAARESVPLYLDRVDFSGEAADVTIFLVDASRPGSRRIRMEDYVTGIGNMKGMIEEVIDFPQTIHDADGDQRPLSHLKRMSRVMLAVVVRHGTFKFERIVIAGKPRAGSGEEPQPSDSTRAAAPPAGGATRQRELPGELALTLSTKPQDQGDGTTAAFTMQVFLSSRFAQADKPIYVHLEGLSAGPGAQAELYLVDRDFRRVEPQLLIGAIEPASAAGSATAPLSLQIADFEYAGVRRTPRTAMRGFAHFALALRVRRGPVSVERLVLSEIPPTTRSEALRRSEGK